MGAATPTIATTASASSPDLPSQLTDEATLRGGHPPFTDPNAGGGSVTFQLFGPNNADCSGTPVFTSSNRPVNEAGVATSEAFTATAPGEWRWIAMYSGNNNNSTSALPATRQTSRSRSGK